MNCREFLLNLIEGRFMSAWVVRDWFLGLPGDDRCEAVRYVLNGLKTHADRRMLWSHLTLTSLCEFLPIALDMEIPEVIVILKKDRALVSGDVLDDEDVDWSDTMIFLLCQLMSRAPLDEFVKFDFAQIQKHVGLDPCGVVPLLREEMASRSFDEGLVFKWWPDRR